MKKPTIVIGEDAAGNLKCLYVGEDAEPARELINNPPAGFVAIAAYKRPEPWKRRKDLTKAEPTAVAAPAQPEAPAAPSVPETGTDPLAELEANAAPETAAEEPAPKKRKK
jgi:hypothetical protein